MQKIEKIGVLSLAKIFGILYAIFGLILGTLFSLFSFVGINADETGLYFGAVSIITVPIIYGILGFVFGAITAFFYNIIARKVGGLEVELTK